ncbi:hypothetical protein PAXRUDRAFT_829683 [Paxillus rubicundulus Ve08.2h10]|uniref:Uncharacterized protein n=1 Tax=Paxillus rubicundulus Ve08.2h10 TaxID=930991 RepID=A0A0D0DMB7_9AGAM|nr:hypothetical protein PAXRUDRAFT_829683 [Paxillus rubicundulus Ve08.2h10]
MTVITISKLRDDVPFNATNFMLNHNHDSQNAQVATLYLKWTIWQYDLISNTMCDTHWIVDG